MREIKFRAWDKNSSRWTNYSIVDDLLRFYDKHTGCWMTDKNQERFKLMQYTGLKDKNGVEIYEGDIIKKAQIYPNGEIEKKVGFVKFRTEDLQIVLGDNTDMWAMTGKNLFETSAVVGNIYENPELISEE